MNPRSDMRQNIQAKLDFSSIPAGEACEAGREEIESRPTRSGTESLASTNRWMEEVCERENLKEALRRVKANKGNSTGTSRALRLNRLRPFSSSTVRQSIARRECSKWLTAGAYSLSRIAVTEQPAEPSHVELGFFAVLRVASRLIVRKSTRKIS
jgi:hypothetical protein